MDKPEEYLGMQNLPYGVTINQFKNLLAFLSIILNEHSLILIDQSPDYILEKFSRYIGPAQSILDTNDHQRGAHPVLYAQVIERYHGKWGKMLGCTLNELLKTI